MCRKHLKISRSLELYVQHSLGNSYSAVCHLCTPFWHGRNAQSLAFFWLDYILFFRLLTWLLRKKKRRQNSAGPFKIQPLSCFSSSSKDWRSRNKVFDKQKNKNELCHFAQTEIASCLCASMVFLALSKKPKQGFRSYPTLVTKNPHSTLLSSGTNTCSRSKSKKNPLFPFKVLLNLWPNFSPCLSPCSFDEWRRTEKGIETKEGKEREEEPGWHI